MKVGDKVKCIFNKDREEYHIKGKIYEILSVNYDTIGISVEPNIYHLICYYKLNDRENYYLLSEYFDVIKLIRKDKLNKLNNERNI